MSARGAVIVIAVAAVFFGCQLTLDLGDKIYVDPTAEEGGAMRAPDAATGSSSGATSNDGGQTGPVDAAPKTCPTGTKGGTMVAVTNPSGGVTCIDATEVTQDQYKAFLDATGGGTDVGNQPPFCAWNSNFKVDQSCITYPWPEPFICSDNPAACGIHPQVCINWCQAYAYCTWAGKRLCGALKGGTLDPAKALDPRESQWSNACTSGNKHTFPYGDTLVPGRCQTGTDPRTTAPVGGHADCQSKEPGYTSVLDLAGNVAEWEDACVAGADDLSAKCFVRGGSFLVEANTRCDDQTRFERAETQPDVGFRCCGP